MKDHEIREIVNQARDIAQKYGHTQQLRAHLSELLVPVLGEARPDPTDIALTRVGSVEITDRGIVVSGFEGENCSCRDLAILAAAWAIGELQREMFKTIKRAGAGNIVIGDEPGDRWELVTEAFVRCVVGASGWPEFMAPQQLLQPGTRIRITDTAKGE